MAVYTMFWIIGGMIAALIARDKLAMGIRRRQGWLRTMIPFLGIRIELAGLEHRPQGSAVYVGNHRSYIDPVVLARYTSGVVIGKAEVSRWPLIGAGARMGGVIFVRREDKDSRSATLQSMEELLRAGYAILVYPEGTTTRAPGLLPFRPGAFRTAAKLNVPVVPVAIEYVDPDDAWIGDDTFVRHFFQTFRKKYVDVRMTFGKPLMNTDDVELLNSAHTWIEGAIKRLLEFHESA